MLFSQTHTATYGDKKYMVCTDKGFYTHCYAKHDLPDGKWMFYHPDTKKLAVVSMDHQELCFARSPGWEMCCRS